MGYAFDSTSNFNATWSNSYASAVLAPGNGVAAGFARAAGKRYFEFVVNSNTDVGYLWLGVLWRLGTMQNGWLLGGGSEVGTTSGGIIGGKSAGLTSITAGAGDVFGFAVNYSTDGIGGMSSVTYAGAGVIEVSKNGVFTGHRAVFTASGPYVAGARPLVIQESGTSTSAVVTLRVDSLSYSYLPAGYSEWGASGGTTVTGPTAAYVWEWSSYNKGDSYSITGTTSATGNVVAYQPASVTASAFTQTLRTVALSTQYKTQFEIRTNLTGSYSDIYIGFIAEGRTTLTYSMENAAFGTTTYVGRIILVSPFAIGNDYTEGVANAGQMRPFGNGLGSGADRVVGGFYDPTRGLIGLYGAAGFTGTTDPDTAATEMFSLTSSTSLYAFLHHAGFTTYAPPTYSPYYANGGWKRMVYPLNPGWRSADLSRYVSPGGCAWERPTTMTGTQTMPNEVVARLQSSAANDSKSVKANVGHSSGKKYFEIHYNSGAPGVGIDMLAGVTANATISFVTDSVEFCAAQSKAVVQYANADQHLLRVDGITISALAALSPVPSSYIYWRPCFAVDFAAGRVWIGYEQNVETRQWINGDPAAGTGGITFTASTTLFPFLGLSSNVAANVVHTAAFQDDAMLFDPPTGFEAWDAGSPGTVTTTATVTPSFTGSISGTNSPGGSGTRKWPFGFRP